MATRKAKSDSPSVPLLSSVAVHGFSLLRNVQVTFEAGLTIITGASGAGKSLLFDAISFCLGARAHRAMLASGSSECRVVLELQLTNEQCALLGMPWQPGPNQLERSYAASGRTRLAINGESAKLPDLEILLRYCFELTGQFESQILFNPGAHLGLVDAFGGDQLGKARGAYLDLYSNYQMLRSRISALRTAAGNRAQEIEFLKFQATELRKAGVRPGERAEVDAELRLQQNAQQLSGAAQRAAALISGDDQTPGARDQTASALREVLEIAGMLGETSEFQTAAERLQGAIAELSDIGEQCRDFAEGLQFDPQLEQKLTDRLDEMNRLERKYACAADQLEELLAEKEERLTILTDEELSPEELERQLQALLPRLLEAGHLLSLERARAAQAMEQLSTIFLRRLDFVEVCLEAGLLPTDEPGPDGLETAELLISLNPGEPPRALAQVASGGEASRILLALKAAMAQKLPFGVMLLDEIEAGLGADSAGKVAEVLRQLAERRQVLAITHLPAVAAAGKQHLLVTKAVSGGQTAVSIAPITNSQRETELARMFGGQSEEASRLSRRLLEAAQQEK